MRKRTEPPRRSGRTTPAGSRAPVHGVARVLSKLGFCSRTAAAALVRDGRVTIAGRVVRDPEAPVAAGVAVAVDGTAVSASAPVHVMLNKPRGLTTTAHDERG
ncbi:MAG TPA: S4 domain-containing protein, partial [Xanthomonadales bacterium]|nr:S4 domain-containing protein [Xanthomonadales bacterium]